MESTVQVPRRETTPVWTEEKHLHFLSTMEASFVRTMLHRYGGSSACHLRLDRHLPDYSESTLDSKPSRTSYKDKRAPSDSLGPRSRMEKRRTRRRRRSSQLPNSMDEQVVPQLENGGEGAAFVGDNDKEADV